MPDVSPDLNCYDLDEIRRRAKAMLDWDGGHALPESIPPAVVIALVDAYRATSPAHPVVAKLLRHGQDMSNVLYQLSKDRAAAESTRRIAHQLHANWDALHKQLEAKKGTP